MLHASYMAYFPQATFLILKGLCLHVIILLMTVSRVTYDNGPK